MLFSIFIAFTSYIFLLATYEYFFLSTTSITQKNINEIQMLYQQKTGILGYIDSFLEKIGKKLTDKLKNSEEQKEVIDKLKRSGISISYEKYIIQKFLTPVLVFIVSYLFSFIVYKLSAGFAYVIRFISMIVAIATYFDIDNQVERKLQDLRNGIITEMPSFLSTYRYSPSSKPLSNIIRDFKKNATYLKYDFNLLEIDIGQYGTEKALRLFRQRINILEVDEVVSILINDLNGDRRDSLINVEILENKFLEKYQHHLEDKLKNRPFYLELLNILAVSFILSLFLVCLLYQLVDSILHLIS